MRPRVTEHIRSNVVGYVAVFLALSGGAYALDGRNSVDSGDIAKAQVKRQDLARNAVTSPKVGPDSLTGQDLAEGTLEQVPSAQNSQTLDGLGTGAFLRNAANVVGSTEVQDGSLGTGDLSHAIPAVRATSIFAQAIPTGTDTSLQFDTEAYDTANMHDTAVNNTRFTVPVTGIYDITAGVGWAFPNAANRLQAELRLNQTTLIASDRRQPIGVTSTIQNVTTQTLLQAGDVVDVRVHQNSGGSLNTLSIPNFPHFSMTWIAPGP